MRFLNLSGPGVSTDDEFCPHCPTALGRAVRRWLCRRSRCKPHPYSDTSHH
jgi:hypothetical protein